MTPVHTQAIDVVDTDDVCESEFPAHSGLAWGPFKNPKDGERRRKSAKDDESRRKTPKHGERQRITL